MPLGQLLSQCQCIDRQTIKNIGQGKSSISLLPFMPVQPSLQDLACPTASREDATPYRAGAADLLCHLLLERTHFALYAGGSLLASTRQFLIHGEGDTNS